MELTPFHIVSVFDDMDDILWVVESVIQGRLRFTHSTERN